MSSLLFWPRKPYIFTVLIFQYYWILLVQRPSQRYNLQQELCTYIGLVCECFLLYATSQPKSKKHPLKCITKQAHCFQLKISLLTWTGFTAFTVALSSMLQPPTSLCVYQDGIVHWFVFCYIFNLGHHFCIKMGLATLWAVGGPTCILNKMIGFSTLYKHTLFLWSTRRKHKAMFNGWSHCLMWWIPKFSMMTAEKGMKCRMLSVS